MQSLDPYFAKIFTEELVRNASEFYVETKTRKTRTNVALLEERVDSVKSALDELMYGAALTQDRNQNLARATGKVNIAKQQMNIQLLSTMYGELIKNLELSKFTLMREEPLVQVIDRPILPLEKKKPGKIRSALLGSVLCGVFTCGWLLLRRLYDKLMIVQGAE
jgi:uncharacterized protein involved in exopolysaccharide biosynthesis